MELKMPAMILRLSFRCRTSLSHFYHLFFKMNLKSIFYYFYVTCKETDLEGVKRSILEKRVRSRIHGFWVQFYTVILQLVIIYLKKKFLTFVTVLPYNMSGILIIRVHPIKQNPFRIRIYVAGYKTRIDLWRILHMNGGQIIAAMWENPG